jgi:GAF domain-containing protein
MVWVNNAHLDPRSRYPTGSRPGIEHFIAAPLKSKGHIFGILVVARNRDPLFTEEEANVVKSFADAVAVALEVGQNQEDRPVTRSPGLEALPHGVTLQESW